MSFPPPTLGLMGATYGETRCQTISQWPKLYRLLISMINDTDFLARAGSS